MASVTFCFREAYFNPYATWLPGPTESEESRFWARGYAVSTVGFEEEQIRKYIRNQEQLDGSGEKGDF